jgi:phosphate transport system permease protein
MPNYKSYTSKLQDKRETPNVPGRAVLKFSPPSRRAKDILGSRAFWLMTLLPLVLVVVMFIALLLRTLPILRVQSIWKLISGTVWLPFQGEFGFLPFIMGTVWVTGVALVLSVPPCLLTAIYLSEYARRSTTSITKPLLDLLAGIPSVVYGVWGLVAVVPVVQKWIAPTLGKWLGFLPLFKVNNPTGYNILSGGFVLAVMIAPVMISVSYEVMRAVPDGLREVSLAVGATRWQTIKYTVLPQALPGIVAAVVLGLSRALGETMAVLMVVGNVAQIPKSIFDAAYPLPALIANNYGEMMSIPMYDAALMGAALVLMVVVLVFNAISAWILRGIIKRSQR